MKYTARDSQKWRDHLKMADGVPLSGIEVDGDALEIRLIPDEDRLMIVVPFNEEGESVSVVVTHGIIKRWKKEALEAKSLMRRMIAGESGTSYRERHSGGSKTGF